MATPASISLFVVGLLLASFGLSGLVAYTIRVSDGDRTLRSFAVLLALVVAWTAGHGIRMLIPSLAGKLLVQRVLYVGVLGSPVAWLVFVLLYTGRDRYLDRNTVTALAAVPALCTLVLAVDPALFYDSVGLVVVDSVPVLSTTAGPLWWLGFGHSYLVLGAGIVVLVQFALTADRLYRFQTAALLAASLLPVVANAAFVFELVGTSVVDLTPLTFAGSMILLFMAVFYADFLDIVPVARDHIIESMKDGVVVVDDDGTIADTNRAATDILSDDTRGKNLVGAQLTALQPTLGELSDGHQTTAGIDEGVEVSVVHDGDTEWYWIREIELTARARADGTAFVLTDITQKKRFERRLRRLQRTHQRLMLADDEDEIVDIAVEAAAEILELPITGIWRHDGEVLRPLGMSQHARTVFNNQPVLEPDDLAWQAYDEGETKTFTDVQQHDQRHNPDSPIESEINVPVGDIGIMSSGSMTRTEFEDVDTDLLRILSGATERAFRRLQRESRLQQQNERLEEFTSVVSHDLRSPLNQIEVYLEMAADDHDDDRLSTARDATDRATEMVDDLLALARQGDIVDDGQDRSLEETVTDAWQSVTTTGAKLEVVPGLGVVEADHARLRQAFENLIRNAVEHGTSSVNTETPQDAVGDGGPAITVQVGPLEDGIYLADDGPGIPASVRDDVFDHGYSTEKSGTGLGLTIVERIVEAHGWSIEATASADDGARFEITGMQPTRPDDAT